MSVEFDLADAIKTAIEAAVSDEAFNLPVAAKVHTRSELDFEKVQDVFVWIIPNAADETPGTLNGDNDNTITINLVVGRNLQRGDDDEVRGMHELTELIVDEINSRVSANSYDWRRTDKNPLWDHDAIGQLIFKAERLIDFYISN